MLSFANIATVPSHTDQLWHYDQQWTFLWVAASWCVARLWWFDDWVKVSPALVACSQLGLERKANRWASSRITGTQSSLTPVLSEGWTSRVHQMGDLVSKFPDLSPIEHLWDVLDTKSDPWRRHFTTSRIKGSAADILMSDTKAVFRRSGQCLKLQHKKNKLVFMSFYSKNGPSRII